jgi:hypothetical protein
VPGYCNGRARTKRASKSNGCGLYSVVVFSADILGRKVRSRSWGWGLSRGMHNACGGHYEILKIAAIEGQIEGRIERQMRTHSRHPELGGTVRARASVFSPIARSSDSVTSPESARSDRPRPTDRALGLTVHPSTLCQIKQIRKSAPPHRAGNKRSAERRPCALGSPSKTV